MFNGLFHIREPKPTNYRYPFMVEP